MNDRFSEGDFCSAVDRYDRPVAGVARSAGIGGWVVLTPFERNDGGAWIQPASVSVRASSCTVIERADVLAQGQEFRDRAFAQLQATWARAAKEGELARQAGGPAISR